MQKSAFSREYQIFLKLLKSARFDARLTQMHLAKRMNASQSFISKCERGERRLDIVELQAWCRALDYPLPAFVAKFDRAAQKER